MSNTCFNSVVLIGSDTALDKAEDDLKRTYGFAWECAESDGDLRVPVTELKKLYRNSPPCRRYELWHPWAPPGELHSFAADNPNVLLAMMYEEPGKGFRGQAFFIDGQLAHLHQGEFGPDGHEMYDESHPLPHFWNFLEYLVYTGDWKGKEAAFGDSSSAEGGDKLLD